MQESYRSDSALVGVSRWLTRTVRISTIQATGVRLYQLGQFGSAGGVRYQDIPDSLGYE